MAGPRYSAQRVAGREHMPIYPKGFVAVRIIQLAVAVAILGLCAYSLTFLSFSGNCLTLFTSIACILISVYYLVAEFGPARAYNYWAVLALDIFMVIFWIVSFALLASQVAPYMGGVTVCGYFTCETVSLSGTDLVVASSLAAASGLGGLEFLLYAIALAVHSAAVHRHRQAGLHCDPASEKGPGPGPDAANAYAMQQQAKNPPIAQPTPYYVPQLHPQPAAAPQHPGGAYPQQQGGQAAYQQPPAVYQQPQGVYQQQ